MRMLDDLGAELAMAKEARDSRPSTVNIGPRVML